MKRNNNNEQAKQELRDMLAKSGHVVYTKLNHVSRSGMLRCISTYIILDGAPYDISYKVAPILGDSIDQKHGGIRVTGCGMDMGFHIVNNLSTTLYLNSDGSYSHEGAYKLAHRWL